MKKFSLIYQGDIHPSTDEKVIPAEDFSKLLDAQEIVEKAHEDRKKLLKKTEEECKVLKQEARAAGQAEGLEKFNEQIFHMENELNAVQFSLQKMVLPIALKAAKKIVGKELSTSPETIVDIVMQAIAPLSQSHQITIFLSKEDKGHLEKEKSKLTKILEHTKILKIEEDPELKQGDCVIKTETGMINATLENQWAALERAFDAYRPSDSS